MAIKYDRTMWTSALKGLPWISSESKLSESEIQPVTILRIQNIAESARPESGGGEEHIADLLID